MSGYEAFAGYYDRLTDNVDYEKRSAYFHGLLCDYGAGTGVTAGVAAGGILLDLACGTGSLSVLMADYGYDVIGVDASAGMLSAAQGKAFDSGRNILFLCQRMQELDLYGTVNAAVCALDSINHLTSERDVRETFRRVSLFLEPGGVFVFDMNTLYKHRHVLADNAFVYDTDEVYCVWQNSLDPGTDAVRITLDFFVPSGGAYRRTSERFSERAYKTEDVLAWLETAGLEVVGVFDELTREPPPPDAQRVVVVARKIEAGYEELERRQ